MGSGNSAQYVPTIKFLAPIMWVLTCMALVIAMASVLALIGWVLRAWTLDAAALLCRLDLTQERHDHLVIVGFCALYAALVVMLLAVPIPALKAHQPEIVWRVVLPLFAFGILCNIVAHAGFRRSI